MNHIDTQNTTLGGNDLTESQQSMADVVGAALAEIWAEDCSQPTNSIPAVMDAVTTRRDPQCGL